MLKPLTIYAIYACKIISEVEGGGVFEAPGSNDRCAYRGAVVGGEVISGRVCNHHHIGIVWRSGVTLLYVTVPTSRCPTQYSIEQDHINSFTAHILPLFLPAPNFYFQIQNHHFTQIDLRIIS